MTLTQIRFSTNEELADMLDDGGLSQEEDLTAALAVAVARLLRYPVYGPPSQHFTFDFAGLPETLQPSNLPATKAKLSCGTCGSTRLAPDPSIYHGDAVREDGASMACLDCITRHSIYVEERPAG